MFGNLSKPMLKSAAGETPLGLPVGRESRRALALERVCRGRLVALPHADEERMRRASRVVRRVARNNALPGATNWRRRRGGAAAAVKVAIPLRGASCWSAWRITTASSAFDRAGSEDRWIARYAWTAHGDGKVDASGTRRPSDYHKVCSSG